MKRQMSLRRVAREMLAQHLREVDILASEAVGEASVYHCRQGKSESMAISLPGDTGLIVELSSAAPPGLERRRRRRSTATETEPATAE